MKFNSAYFMIFYIIFLDYSSSIYNSTDCQSMYLNSTIDISCINFDSCCMIEYQFYSSNFINCILKIKSVDDVCSVMQNSVKYYGANLLNCNCYSFWLKGNIYFYILLILIIL